MIDFSPRWPWLAALALVFGGVTFLFPLLAAAVALARSLGRSKIRAELPREIEILVPAFNEEDTLRPTLESLVRAVTAWQAADPGARGRITVGLDGSGEATRAIAREVASSAGIVSVLDRGMNLGKWATLRELVAQSGAAWSAIVDSGTLWDEDFLVKMAPEMAGRNCLGLAPGYRPDRATLLERVVWWQERTLKRLENWSGGPISLHGATILFRTRELREAFDFLGKDNWLNDDVVLGMVMRSRGRIHYLGSRLCVHDCGIRPGASELNRRRRLVRGNIQWIRSLLPRVARRSPEVALLAARRIVRIFWAYDLILSSCFALLFINLGPHRFLAAAALMTALGALALASNRRLRQAAWVSLTAPWLIFSKKAPHSWA